MVQANKTAPPPYTFTLAWVPKFFIELLTILGTIIMYCLEDPQR